MSSVVSYDIDSENEYGNIHSFLPEPYPRVNRVITKDPERPQGSVLRLDQFPTFLGISKPYNRKIEEERVVDGETCDFFQFTSYAMCEALKGRPVKPIQKDFSNPDRLDDKLSVMYWQSYKSKPPDKRLKFIDLPTVGHAMFILERFSHLRYNFFPSRIEKSKFRNKTLSPIELGIFLQKRENFRRITCFLAGRPKEQLKMPKWYDKPLVKSRAARFICCLQNIDGLVTQVILSFFDMKWNFKSLDLLIRDQLFAFLDDEYSPPVLGKDEVKQLFFTRLKKFRKTLQFHGKALNDLTAVINGDAESGCMIPPEMSFWRPLLEHLNTLRGTNEFLFRISILCQTRGASTPCRAIAVDSARKFIETVSIQCEKYPKHRADMLLRHTDLIWGNVDLKKALPKLTRAAKLHITGAACLDYLRKDGGKLEAARRVFQEYKGTSIHKVDLATGKLTEETISVEENSTDVHMGDFLFHWSLQFYIQNPQDIRTVEYVTAVEPGKARSVTKSHLAATVLLFPASGILAEFLALIPSSRDGLKAGAAGWQFFQRLDFSNPAASFLYEGIREEELQLPDGSYVNYQQCPEVFGYCVDYETATDYGDWNVGRLLLGSSLYRLGFPKWYSGACINLSNSPRRLIYKETVLGDKGENLSYVTEIVTKRGWLMGDPLTKGILHLVNLTSRSVALELAPKVSLSPLTRSFVEPRTAAQLVNPSSADS